ncbi:MAG: putative lipid II flippase FtsW [Candidatus Omnitrophica bacterium]|nr:putative lipid II flippase FtsW [Candidatus Omnitrophota bacterium]
MTPKTLRQLMLVIITILLGIGLMAVYSASAVMAETTYGNSLRFALHHVFSIVIGALLGIACLMVPYEALRRSGRWLMGLSLVLLVLVDVVGQEIGGASRWFRIGGFSFQPSELAKISLILYLADLLARKAGMMHEWWRGVAPALIATGLTAGLVLIQPDLGTTMTMGAVTLLLLVVARARWRHLAGVAIFAAAALVILIAGAEYRRRRIMMFLDPWADPLGSGYQILQSYCSLAGGGLFGTGLGGSLQKLFFLPSAHTDFIFAIIGEELGFIGTTSILLLFALFVTCGFRIAIASHDLFSKYLVCGLVGMIGLQAMVNIAVVTGLIPTKGLPLPLISFGGSSMVMNVVACALIFQASRQGERCGESALGR